MLKLVGRKLRKFTLPQLIFLEKKVSGTTYGKLAELFNKRFKTDFSEEQIRAVCIRNGLRNGLPGGGQRPGSQKLPQLPHKIISFIQKNMKGKTYNELAESIYKQFGLSLTRWRIKHAIQLSGIRNVCGSRSKPVGTEIKTPEGYIRVKVFDTGKFSDDWKYKHIFLWEQENGSVPEGHCIVFADQNRENCELDNLLMVSRSELSQLLGYGMIFKNKELTKTGLVILRHKISLNKAIDRNIQGEKENGLQKR